MTPSESRRRRISGNGRSSSPLTSEVCLRRCSLFALVAQMVGLVLLMRYSRVRGKTRAENGDTEPEQMYLASTAVFLMEAMKFVTCLVVVYVQCGLSFADFSREIQTHVWSSPAELAKLSVPSFLYTVQNNLLYLALTNLDAATYQVCYQLKILTTALFSAVLLKRHFPPFKWFSLLILTVGVAIVQRSGSSGEGDGAKDRGGDKEAELQKNRLIGLAAVLCAACTSGFSGVYFEKILKGSKTSLWIRNIQMGITAVIIAFLTVFVRDGATVRERGFLVGYSGLVWTVVAVQAVGGLIVAVVVRYADNVLKVFATSFSIVVSCVISAFLSDFRPNLSFCIGTTLVVASTVMYSYNPNSAKKGDKSVNSRKGKDGHAAKSSLPMTVMKV